MLCFGLVASSTLAGAPTAELTKVQSAKDASNSRALSREAVAVTDETPLDKAMHSFDQIMPNVPGVWIDRMHLTYNTSREAGVQVGGSVYVIGGEGNKGGYFPLSM